MKVKASFVTEDSLFTVNLSMSRRGQADAG